ncbi:MAG: hypothetical protein QM724_14125 [Flavobacteriales bacterium]
MRLPLLSILMLAGSGLCAQSLFQRVYDCSYGDMRAGDRVGEGSYWAYAFYDEAFGYHRAVGVVKYGADDAPLWNKVFEAPSAEVGLDVSDLVTTSDGGLVWVGSRSNGLADSALVVKVTAVGGIGWSLALPAFLPPGASSASTAQLRRVDEAANGDVIVAGFFSYFDGGLYRRAFVARIGAGGAVQWTRSYALPTAQGAVNYSYDVQALSGGGLLLLGGNAGNGAWLTRLQDDGTVAWTKGYSTNDGAEAMAPVAVRPTGTGFDIFLQPDLYSGDIACVMHTNTSGDLLSTTKYRMAVGLGSMAGVRPLAGGGYLIASATNLTGEYERSNAHLLVVGADNIPILSASFGVPDEAEYARVVLAASGGGYLLGGGAAYVDLDAHRGGTAARPYLVRTDAGGNYVCGDPVEILVGDTVLTSASQTLEVQAITGWATSALTSADWLNAVTVCSTMGLAEEEASSFTLSPNPASDRLTILPADQAAWDHVLFDAMGRAVRSHARAIGRVELDVRGLTPGRYVLRSSGPSTVRSSAVMVGR